MNLHTTAVHLALTAAVLAALLSASCINPLFSNGSTLSDITLASNLNADNLPLDARASFYIDTPQICCSAKLSGAYPGMVICADWWKIERKNSGNTRTLIYEDSINTKTDGYLGFTLTTPAAGFSVGDYCLNLSVDGKPTAELPFAIQRDNSLPPPSISFFVAEPSNIIAGQTCKLDWKVTGASKISIEPLIGTVPMEGSKVVTPDVDTTFELWALNRNGNSYGSLSVKVTKPVTGRSRLEISEFWSSGNYISYRIKNTGNLASCPTETYLYRNGLLESTDYVDTLQPGEERVEQFGRFHFSPRFHPLANLDLTDGTGEYVNLRVCANGGAACPEICNANSCLEHNYGMLLNLDLFQYLAAARWDCSAGTPIWSASPGASDVIGRIPSGHMVKDSNYLESLLVSPPREGGWLQCLIGLPGENATAFRPFYIPHKCVFSMRLGLTENTSKSADVKFSFGTVMGDNINYFPPVTLTKGKLQTYEADLSQLACQKVEFVLRIESTEPLLQGSVVWAEPSLIQQQ